MKTFVCIQNSVTDMTNFAFQAIEYYVNKNGSQMERSHPLDL